jgi:hypothetical protein
LPEVKAKTGFGRSTIYAVMVWPPMKTNQPFVKCAVLLSSMAKAALHPNKLGTAAKCVNARVSLILLAHKPSTCFTQPAGVKPPKA